MVTNLRWPFQVFVSVRALMMKAKLTTGVTEIKCLNG